MKFSKFICSKVTISVTFAVSVIAAVINFSMMHSYVYIDNALFNSFCLTLSIFFILSIVLNFGLIVCKFKGIQYKDKPVGECKGAQNGEEHVDGRKDAQNEEDLVGERNDAQNEEGLVGERRDIPHKDKFISESKVFKVIACVNIVFAIVFLILDIVNLVLNSEALYMIWLNFSKIVPFVAVAISVLFLTFLFPAIKNRKGKIVVVSVLCGVIFCHVLLAIFPISIYKFEASPMVVDNGSGYSIVFATTDKGTGYVEYEYNGEKFKVYDEINGKKNSSKIHTIKVPYEHIDGNSYAVGSTRVIQELTYGGRLGKSIASDKFAFNAPKGDLDILTISDWHTHNAKVKKSVGYLGGYNCVIMLGDSAAGLMYEEEVIKYIIKLGGEITNGGMPIIWVRGNHETRGPIAKNVSKYLGLDEFYYIAKLGSTNFVVLDSAEDKADSHSEYGGMNDFENYRKEMVDRLEHLPNDLGRNIVLSHDVKLCIERELQARAMAKLEQLGTSLIVGGHTHVVDFDDSKAIKTYVDGGYKDGKFVSSKISISGDSITIFAVDNKGNKVYGNTLKDIFAA